MKYADIIVPRGRPEILTEQNRIAVEFVVHNLEHHLVKAGYEIVVPELELFELCEESEMKSSQSVIRAMPRPVETKIQVIAKDNDT